MICSSMVPLICTHLPDNIQSQSHAIFLCWQSSCSSVLISCYYSNISPNNSSLKLLTETVANLLTHLPQTLPINPTHYTLGSVFLTSPNNSSLRLLTETICLLAGSKLLAASHSSIFSSVSRNSMCTLPLLPPRRHL